MFAGSMILAVTLIAFAAWLQWSESNGWGDGELSETELDQRYFRQRGRSRRRTNLIIGICGLLILVAAIAGGGPIWIAAWLCVTLALATVVGLAGLDVLRTHRYHTAKMQDLINRRSVSK